jgi:uncharacterized glyoxalase superfamily protein PhnB
VFLEFENKNIIKSLYVIQMSKKTSKTKIKIVAKSSSKQISLSTNSIDKLGMFNIAVKEIEMLKEFYTYVLGFNVVAENKYGDIHFVKMSVPGDSAINLIKETPNDPSNALKAGMMKLYHFTSDITACYKDLTLKGVKTNNEIQEQQWDRKVKQFDFNDPDGNQWFAVQFLN